MLWACVLLPNLALDSVLRQRQDAGPLVLVAGSAQARRLVAVNAAARAAGLYPGQPLMAAQALLARFDASPFDPAATARWLELLASVVYRYSSEVCLLPHALVLEVSRSLRLFGPWPRLAAALRADFTALGFRQRLAVAPTAHAAWVLASVGDGRAVLDPAGLRPALQRIGVQRGHLPEAAAQALPGMGIRTLGQLLDLPRDGLRRRFGASLLDALDRLTGTLPAGLATWRPPAVFDLRIELTHEVENLQALAFPLRRMTGDLAACLTGRDGGVQRFVLHLEHRDQPATAVPVGLLAPERDAGMLFELTQGRLAQLQLPAPVLGLRLVARDLPSFTPSGRDLFDTRPTQALPMVQLRERLRARLGDEAVYRLGGTTDPRPELAQAVTANTDAPPESRPRPSWLLARPLPLRGPSPHILAGPERLETGWWDGAEVRRDYYVVETARGQRAWAFCAPGEQSGWMLHGWFA